ncbi:MAG: hypothetical protein PHT07_09335 [Paludibacter sp.]|nr:hypothetical protein [Paludibacter sp.]
MNLRFFILVFISFSVFLVSCEADIDLQNISNEVSLHPDLIVPIGSASLTLGQIISNNDPTKQFLIGDNSEISYLRFESYEYPIPAFNFLKNSQELTRNINLTPVGAPIPPYFTLPPITDNVIVNLGINSNNENRIDSLLVKSATISMIVDVSSDLRSISPSNLNFSIVFPNGQIRMLNGKSNIVTCTPGGYGMINNIPISDFMLNTSGAESGIPIQILIEAKTGALPIILTPTTAITCKINFTKLDYSVVYGSFKSSLNIPIPLEQRIDLDKDLPNGLIKFANPQVFITATSNVGAYLNFQIDYIKAFLSTNQNLTPVYANFNGKQSTDIGLGRKPKIPGDTIRIPLRTLDKDWGDTNLLFENESKPDMLEYQFSAKIDPTIRIDDKTPDFLTSDAKIKVDVKTVVPLNFTKGSYYEFKDSITNVFLLLSNALNQNLYTDITYTALILNISNGLPVKTTFTFDLIDSVGKVLPTTFEKKYVIEAGKVDANGLVQPGKETKQTLQIAVSKEQLSTLKKAKSIAYKVRIEGADINSNIHFTKLNTFDLKVGLFVKGEINTTIGTKTQK